MSRTALRVCSWNIQMGSRLDAVLDTMRSAPEFEAVDLVALQEASEHKGRVDAAAVAGCLGNGYLHHQVTAQHLRGAPQANALVWNSARLEALAVRDIPLPVPPAGSALAHVWSQRRGAVALDATVDGTKRLRIYSAHLDVLGFAHRVRQLSAVLQDHAAQPAVEHALIAADMNTFGVRSVPGWAALRAAAAGAGFVDVTRDVRWTHSVARLRQKLDAVFVTTPAIVESRSWTLRSDASDHLPLFVEVVWE